MSDAEQDSHFSFYCLLLLFGIHMSHTGNGMGLIKKSFRQTQAHSTFPICFRETIKFLILSARGVPSIPSLPLISSATTISLILLILLFPFHLFHLIPSNRLNVMVDCLDSIFSAKYSQKQITECRIGNCEEKVFVFPISGN